MGRRKIEIQPLSDDRNRTVTFVKRKAGLFKKAHELAVLCQVDIAVLIVGSNDKIYEFSLVDTKEIIKAYQRTSKLQEEKSPESYGRYTKKAKLGSRKIGNIDDDDIIINDDGDLDYDSEGDVKRLKRSYDDMMQTDSAPGPRLNLIPTFTYNKASGTNRNSQGPPITTGAELKDKASDSGRPVLRVQIPSDVKSEIPDSAKTITALDLNLHEKNGGVGDIDKNRKPGSANPAPVINSARYQTMGVFRLPDTRRPITTLPLPIQSKSLTLSPSSATAPPLPNSMGSFYGSMPQNNQYTGNLILPTPILTQIFNQQYVMGNQQRQQTPQMPIQNPSQLMLKVNPGNAGSPDHSQQVNDQNHPARHDETSRTGPQSSSVGSSTTGPVNQNESAAGVAGDVANQYGQGKFRPPFFSTGSSTMNVNTQANLSNGEQTPVSGLPSRYMDMFPLPSNFYASQDWLNSGVTPMHLMMPHYFASAAPQSAVTTTAARPPPGGGLPQQQQQQQQHQNWAHQQQAPPQQQQPQQERLLGDQPSPTSQQQSQQHP